LQATDLKASLAKVGVEPRGTSPGEGAQFLRAEFDKWKQVIIEGKIKKTDRVDFRSRSIRGSMPEMRGS